MIHLLVGTPDEVVHPFTTVKERFRLVTILDNHGIQRIDREYWQKYSSSTLKLLMRLLEEFREISPVKLVQFAIEVHAPFVASSVEGHILRQRIRTYYFMQLFVNCENADDRENETMRVGGLLGRVLGGHFRSNGDRTAVWLCFLKLYKRYTDRNRIWDAIFTQIEYLFLSKYLLGHPPHRLKDFIDWDMWRAFCRLLSTAERRALFRAFQREVEDYQSQRFYLESHVKIAYQELLARSGYIRSGNTYVNQTRES